MHTKIVELTNGFNWGKFLLGRFDAEEWARRPSIEHPYAEHLPLLASIGWGPEHVWILDLQTGEGACFRPGGCVKADLEKHKIWVCPMFEIFLGCHRAIRARNTPSFPRRAGAPANAHVPQDLFGCVDLAGHGAQASRGVPALRLHDGSPSALA